MERWYCTHLATARASPSDVVVTMHTRVADGVAEPLPAAAAVREGKGRPGLECMWSIVATAGSALWIPAPTLHWITAIKSSSSSRSPGVAARMAVPGVGRLEEGAWGF
mmetsp:Transcript_4892/g.15983  ORF Transcript_4892/g.15983 Transcript_4892/m.15983 type:complete len:108 (+) Transcript_4892:1074-1397(+)